MEKKIITGIFLIPTSSNPSNPNVTEMIANQIGHFHCEIHSDVAGIRYMGKLSNEHKAKLDKIAENYCYNVIYIETYEDDNRLNNNTICLL